MAEQLSYKGLDIELEFKGDDHAEVTIDGREFTLIRHEGPLRLWACDDAYFMSDDVMDVVRHLIDYWHLIVSPDRAGPEGPHHGHIPEVPGNIVSAHPIPPRELVPDDEEGGHRGHGGHGKGNGGERGSGTQSNGHSES